MVHVYEKIYEFSASAGALEGYVYRRAELDLKALKNWTDNLVAAYQSMPPHVRDEIQSGLNKTLGRAIKSITAELGEEHDIVEKLRIMVSGHLPESADDFQKRKWFQKKDG